MERYIDANKIPYFHYTGDDAAAEGVDYTLKGVIENRVPTEDIRPESTASGYRSMIISADTTNVI